MKKRLEFARRKHFLEIKKLSLLFRHIGQIWMFSVVVALLVVCVILRAVKIYLLQINAVSLNFPFKY